MSESCLVLSPACKVLASLSCSITSKRLITLQLEERISLKIRKVRLKRRIYVHIQTRGRVYRTYHSHTGVFAAVNPKSRLHLYELSGLVGLNLGEMMARLRTHLVMATHGLGYKHSPSSCALRWYDSSSQRSIGMLVSPRSPTSSRVSRL